MQPFNLETLPAMTTDKQVAALFGCSKATVWRHVKAGLLPAPVKIGNVTRWVTSELAQALEQKMAQRKD